MNFDPDKGFVHFAFADEDIYIKTSLLEFNRQKNLYYELKKSNYNTVFFVELTDRDYHLVCGDSLAKKVYDDSRKKSFLSLFMDYEQSEFAAKKEDIYFSRDKRDEFIDCLGRMMTSSDRTAFVISIEVFDDFQGSRSAQKLITDLSKDNYKRKNMLLVVSDTHQDASFRRFCDPDSIFRTDAFPEIRALFDDYENVRLYDEMKKKMIDRIYFFNTKPYWEIRNLVLSRILTFDDRENYLPALEDYASIVWLFTHSARFRTQVSSLCPELERAFRLSERMFLSELKSSLSRRDVYTIMDSVRKKIRLEMKDQDQSLLKLVEESDTMDSFQQLIYRADPELRQLESLDWRGGIKEPLSENDRLKMLRIESRLGEIRQEIASIHVVSDPDNHKMLFDFRKQFMHHVHTAAEKGDLQYLDLALRALEYVVCKAEKQSFIMHTASGTSEVKTHEGQVKILTDYSLALDVQQKMEPQKRQQREYREAIAEKAEEFQEERRKLKQIKADNPGILEQAKDPSNQSSIITDFKIRVGRYRSLKDIQKYLVELLLACSMNLDTQQKKVDALLGDIGVMETISYQTVLPDDVLSTEDIQILLNEADKAASRNKIFFNDLHQKLNQDHFISYDDSQNLDLLDAELLDKELLDDDLDDELNNLMNLNI